MLGRAWYVGGVAEIGCAMVGDPGDDGGDCNADDDGGSDAA